jgi:LysM repeat protein
VAERVVLPGETLWEIAGEVAPGVDRRVTVAQIVKLNDLASAEVHAGQRLAVPARTR